MRRSWWRRCVRGLNRSLGRNVKAPHRKCERRLTLEHLEIRKLLTATVSVQPEYIAAGKVGDVTFTLNGTIAAPATLDFAVVNGAAVQGTDFFIPPWTQVTFQPGESADTVPVFTHADPNATADKSFTVMISNPTGELSLGTSQAVYTVVESVSNPLPLGGVTPMGPRPLTTTPVVSITGPGTVPEGSVAPFLVSLSTPASAAVNVWYQTSNGLATAGTNYVASSNEITIAAGGSTAWIYVSTEDDHIYEQNTLNFYVFLTTAAGAAIPSQNWASANISNIDPPPGVTISNAPVVDEGGTANFQVTLSEESNAPTTVYYKTVDGSAKAGTNYAGTSTGAIVIPPLTFTSSIPVTTIDDGVYEPNAMDFSVDLTSAAIGGVGLSVGPSATGLINNIDPPPANRFPTCPCTSVTNIAGVAATDPPTVPGGADLSSPNAFGPDFSVSPPATLNIYATEAEVTSQNNEIQLWTKSGSSYTPTNPVLQGSLVAGTNSLGNELTETDPDGTQWIFAGSGATGFTAGQLEQMIPPGGSGAVAYSYNPTGNQWSTTKQTSGSTSQVATYTTNSSGQLVRESVDNVSNGTSAAVGSASFYYYTASSSGGRAGDLELMETFDSDNESGSVVNATFYRDYEGSYAPSTSVGYSSSFNAGLPDELKFSVSGTDLQRLMSANSLSFNGSLPANLDAIPDANIDPYADDFYKYTTAGLVEEIDAAGGGCSSCGGVGESTFAYAYSGSTNYSPNQWYAETIQTRADGSEVTKFTDFQGETILQDSWNGLTGSSARHSILYNQFDSNGNLLAAYQPSAMTGANAYTFNSTTKVLTESPNTTTGLVDVYSYYSTTTATTTAAGGVAGWICQTAVAQGATQAAIPIGNSGGPVLQSGTSYIAATVGTITSYFTSSSTQYQGTGGSGVETTSYAYTFFANTPAPTIASMTTTLPVVGNSQNGTGTAAMTEVVYNALGQVVWSMDANGSISYTAYDPATGAVVQQIQDVNMAGNTSDTQFQSDLTLLSNLNLNWSTESGYGQNLVTTYQVDSQGRTIEETTPDGDVTFTVYNDANHEIRVYPGWHENSSGQWLPTGPVSDYRTDSTGKYTETLTYSWTNVANLQSYLNTNNTPTGQEPLTGSNVAIQSLSRSILDSSGQVISSLQYVNFNGTSYSTTTAAFGTWGTNYVETDYTYDPMGRAESTITPAGAVSFTVYNGLGQATDQWAGTTTATSYTARNAVIAAFRASGDDSPSPGGAHLYSQRGEPLRHFVQRLQRRRRGHGDDRLRRWQLGPQPCLLLRLRLDGPANLCGGPVRRGRRHLHDDHLR